MQSRSIALADPSDAVRRYAEIAAAGALVATFVQLAAGAASDRRRAARGGRGEFYAVGVALALPALAWFYLAPGFGQLAAAFLLLQVALNVVGGPYQAIIPDFIARAFRGRAAGWMAAYQSLGNAAGLLIAAFVHEPVVIVLALGAPLAGTWAITASYARKLTVGRDPRATTSAGSISEGSAGAGTTGSGPLVVLLLSRGAINVGFYTLLGFLLFFVRDALGVRGAALETQSGLIFLTFTLTAIVGAVLAARPADRHDKRVVVSVAVAAIALALAALSQATSLASAYAAAAAAGMAWGAFVSADWALATALLPEGRMATAMGVWNIATTVPQVIAPLIAAPLVLRVGATNAAAGPRAALLLALIEFVAGGLLVWRLPRA